MIRDKVQAGVIHLLPISANNQVVDIFTKPLAPGPFSSCHSKLGMNNFHTPACRGLQLNQKAAKSTQASGDKIDPT